MFVDYVEPKSLSNNGPPPPAVPPKISKKQPSPSAPPPPPPSTLGQRPKMAVPIGSPNSTSIYPQRSLEFQGELKEKCMTFFSSVTRARVEGEEAGSSKDGDVRSVASRDVNTKL